MADSSNVELIPEQEKESKKFFATTEDYDNFCRKFVEEVGPRLEKQREARQQSEVDTKLRLMR